MLIAPGRSEQVLAVYVYVPAHAFCAARWETARGGLAALAALLAAWALLELAAGAWGGVGLLLTAAAWGAGRALRERETLAAELEERARELEDEREAHAALSVRYERARIASEMHDIVAHAISVMVIQASAGQRLAARDPEATDATFGAIAGAARQAEEDMRRSSSPANARACRPSRSRPPTTSSRRDSPTRCGTPQARRSACVSTARRTRSLSP